MTKKLFTPYWTKHYFVPLPSDGEWEDTMVLSFEINEASAKVREGAPKDDEEDYDLNVWADVQPLKLERKSLIPDPILNTEVAIPPYLT